MKKITINANDLSENEQDILFNLLLDRALLSTSPEDWDGMPNEFIRIRIPKQIKNFINTSNTDTEKLTEYIITHLVIKGIVQISTNYKEMDVDDHITQLITMAQTKGANN